MRDIYVGPPRQGNQTKRIEEKYGAEKPNRKNSAGEKAIQRAAEEAAQRDRVSEQKGSRVQ